MLSHLHSRIKRNVLWPGLFFLLAANVIGFDFFPIRRPQAPRPAQAQPAPAGSTVSFMTSVATLDYQGQKAQNRAQTVSLAKIERQTSSTWATYVLSGKGGFRIGKDGTAAFYGMAPIIVSRNLSDDRLFGDERGLSPWITVINSTLNGLTHKHLASGAWEEPITLSLGDGFPDTVPVRFRAQPLPDPDIKWVVITADSGLISFRALDEKYQDSLIYGRYRGVLVYSPTEDAFLQAAAAFTLYHSEDQFRIEQVHFAADASGKQLQPVLDVGPYLDFQPEAPAIAKQGAFPSWCIQAAHVLDILHLAIMTAAEGSTNPVFIAQLEQSILNLINHDYNLIEKVLGKLAAEEFLGNWMKILNFFNTQRKAGTAKAMYELGKDLGKDLIIGAINVLPLGIGNMVKFMELAFTVQQAASDQMDYDLNKLMRAAFSRPARPVQTEPPPPPVQVKKPKKILSGSDWIPVALLAGATGVWGVHELIKKAGKDGDDDEGGGDFPIGVTNHCSQNITSFTVNGVEYGPINAGADKTFSIRKTGSCTTINYSWRTSLNFSGSGSLRRISRCGFIFEDNFQSDLPPIVGVPVPENEC